MSGPFAAMMAAADGIMGFATALGAASGLSLLLAPRAGLAVTGLIYFAFVGVELWAKFA